MLSKVQSHYRKVTQGTISNQEYFCKFISLYFFEPVSAALFLLETAVFAPVWVMIQPGTFLTLLLAKVLQLMVQFNQCLTK